ncbi:hypothetical protein CCHR01_03376 [Colletotrichum chrysophilum]|uniref:Uncharacterized protein n=1 Tax=Colletotrichum chrysophilum TaxID=1836956 RepID=A0AAD9AT15_9PEZI|nr:hypothetical protein CCHR01_03376 [Colletotrichum chrysophilum]
MFRKWVFIHPPLETRRLLQSKARLVTGSRALVQGSKTRASFSCAGLRMPLLRNHGTYAQTLESTLFFFFLLLPYWCKPRNVGGRLTRSDTGDIGDNGWHHSSGALTSHHE